MAFVWMFLVILCSLASAVQIELVECEPPDVPVRGGYGPQQSYYIPGDVIHYFCDVGTFMGGHFYSICEDTGGWIGNTPFCDVPSSFSSTNQSSDADEASTSGRAVDGQKRTCSETIGFGRDEWYGNFTQPGQLIRVLLFLPKGPVSYSVVLVKESGEEIVCDNKTANNDRYDWAVHNCPEPHNTGAAGLKIKSLTDTPLKICEIEAYVLPSPKCIDPHVFVENGHLLLTRQTAKLSCDRGYTKSPNTKLECVHEGEWSKKSLYCFQQDCETEDTSTDNETRLDPGNSNREAKRRQ